MTAVAHSLRVRGIEPTIVDLSRFPRHQKLTIHDGVPRMRGLDLAAIERWYVRALPLPLPFLPADQADAGQTRDELLSRARTAYAAGRERRSFVAGFTAALVASGAGLINPPDAMLQHFRKLEQLDRLRSAGVPIPSTLATNDPEAVIAFTDDGRRPVVYKPLAGGGQCHRLTPDDLEPDRLCLLSRAPVLFQEEVPGHNLRVYVVNGAVVASYEIVSEALDYRGAETAVMTTTLTDDETAACLRSAMACGMAWAGIDLRRRPDGSFAVLEANPSPMFAAVQQRTATTAVSDALARALVC